MIPVQANIESISSFFGYYRFGIFIKSYKMYVNICLVITPQK